MPMTRRASRCIPSDAASVLGQIDVVLPIVHGPLGEDGALQGLLRMANLPFVGSPVLGSAVAMDKDVTKRLLRDAGLQVAPWLCIRRHQAAAVDVEAVIAQLGLPTLFVQEGGYKVDTLRANVNSLVEGYLSRQGA
ncbi:hypothetical protein G6F22_016115 [Rhizopus arrhizus]|nr:hypothetical protein G6F22_016115 [Rhizopus arrhizus]